MELWWAMKATGVSSWGKLTLRMRTRPNRWASSATSYGAVEMKFPIETSRRQKMKEEVLIWTLGGGRPSAANAVCGMVAERERIHSYCARSPSASLRLARGIADLAPN